MLLQLSLKFTKVRSKRLTAPSALHFISTEKILGNKHSLVSMILSSDGLVYGLCALMCGSVALLDDYAQFGNMEREAHKIQFVLALLCRVKQVFIRKCDKNIYFATRARQIVKSRGGNGPRPQKYMIKS